MDGEVLVRVERVSKKFCRSLKRSLWYGVLDLGSEIGGRDGAGRLVLRRDEFLAVNDVSFELARGETLGLIGANGAGKSTLLKLLNGLVKPDAGRLEIRGRVGALIELGAGFSPILSGRENILVNAAVLGLSSREVARRFDEIVEFSGLAEFMGMPLQSYSSGMKVRLGFSIAAHLEPDVLLVDEVLAVGDAAFRTRCLNKISELAKKAAVIFVSHHMPLVSRVSNRIALLEKGRLVHFGDEVAVGIDRYLSSLPRPVRGSSGEGRVRLEGISLWGGAERATGEEISVEAGEDVRVELKVRAESGVSPFCIGLVLSDAEEQSAIECDSRRGGLPVIERAGEFVIEVSMPSLPMTTGKYYLTVYFVELAKDGKLGTILQVEKNVARLDVHDAIHGFSALQLPASWSIQE